MAGCLLCLNESGPVFWEVCVFCPDVFPAIWANPPIFAAPPLRDMNRINELASIQPAPTATIVLR